MVAVQVFQAAQLDPSRFETPLPLTLILVFWVVIIWISAHRWMKLAKSPKGGEGKNDNRTRIAQAFTAVGVFGLLVTFVAAPNVREFGSSIAGLFGDITIGELKIGAVNVLLIAIVVMWFWWFTRPSTGKLVFAALLSLGGIVVIPWLSETAVAVVNNLGSFLFNIFFVNVPNFLLGIGE